MTIGLLTFALELALLVSQNTMGNCQDYTAHLVTDLRTYNYEAFPVCGIWIPNGYRGGYHAWVGLRLGNATFYIEPQTGKLVFPIPIWEGDLANGGYFISRRCIIRGVI